MSHMQNVQVGSPAPAFTAEALVGREFKTVSLHDYRGKWVLLCFYPMDFTFVCPTELVSLNDNYGEFADRDTVILGVSTDTKYSHLGWVKAEKDLAHLQYPLLADVTKKMARDYGVLLEDQGVALRGSFLIDPEGTLRFAQINDLNVGRNTAELLRVLDALQTDKLCPCDWKKGEATL